MALITSAASGNFSAGATWTGGVVPTVGDEARASTGHTVTIDVNTTCDEISTAGTGKFVINDGVTLTANVTNKSNSGNALEFGATFPSVATIVGNVTSGTGGGNGVNNLSSGTLNITGNCNTVSTSTGATVAALRNSSTGIVNVTGNCEGGSGSGTNAAGVFNASTGAINITGNCQAGSSIVGWGAFQNSTGTLSIIGTVTASQAAAGVTGASVQQVTILSGPFITETTRGVNPVYCAAWRWNASPSNSTYLEVMTNDLLTKRNLVTEDNVTGMPAEADVKDGVVYGPASELTGTFEQTVAPSVSDIADAVWSATTRTLTEGGGISAEDVWTYATREITGGTVDTLVNAPTVPTAEDIATEVWDTPTSGLTTSGAIGTRLKNSSTVATTGSQLAAALS
jgi:hypothetical protein